ncbi:hypothetical protein EAI_06754 [Harpegnathos saltator]|uniref:Mab-21-like HhH/H2TH-like domain-containing protein n=1 Tax=Harpegnathos saltator TaxID=610380 RepID=E2BK08_HARSA|nr:hypothetical protein EAI_06754 [Harpegnathos saltator]
MDSNDREKIRRYLVNDEIFKKINKQIITLEIKDVKDTNERLGKIRVRKSGPAFTLSFHSGKYLINIDLVPNSDKDVYLVPKPLSSKNIPSHAKSKPNRYWRLSFYDFEKDMLQTEKYRQVKPIIRQLKKFRETQNWKSIASYYIETLCFHHLERFETRESHTSLLFTMLENLHKAFEIGCIKHYWVKNINLLENIEKDEMMNMKRRLYNIIKDIRKQIIEQPNDLYIIARYTCKYL